MVLPYQQHQKIRQSIQKSQSSSNHSLDILRNKPFWIWDKSEHLQKAIETNQNCCFQHIVKCPTKGGREYPLFSYEKLIYDTLMTEDSNSKDSFKDKHLFVKKATGIGCTELMLRIIA